MLSTPRILAVALAGALVIAACGSDDGDGASATTVVEATDDTTASTVVTTETAPATTETAPATTDAEPEQDVAADTAAAEAGVLTLADLPEGWTEAPADGVATELDGRLAECLELDGDRIGASPASAVAGAFTAPDGTPSVVQYVGVQPTELDARAVVARFAVPDVPACFALAYADLSAELLAGTVADGAEIGAATAEGLAIASVGDATQAVRVVVPVAGDPGVTVVTIDHVLVRAGRSLTTLVVENTAEATPVETIDAVAAAAAERLAS